MYGNLREGKILQSLGDSPLTDITESTVLLPRLNLRTLWSARIGWQNQCGHTQRQQRFKALQNHDMLAAQKFVENVYYHKLTRELVKFGYQIENKPRGDFEIKGVSPQLIEKFSKRHRQIDESMRELIARKPEKANGNVAAIRENIAHRERPPKVRDMALPRLQSMWDSQMTAARCRSSINRGNTWSFRR